MPAERTGPVAGVVLAAGTSTRMGRNKLFLELHGQPLVRQVVERASKAGFDPLFVVLGHEADLVQRALEGLPYRPEMMGTLIDKYRRGVAPLVISDYGGVNAPPMLYDRSLFPELAASEGQGCGKHVVKRHRHESESVSWPVEALTDVDEPADYERVKALREH